MAENLCSVGKTISLIPALQTNKTKPRKVAQTHNPQHLWGVGALRQEDGELN